MDEEVQEQAAAEYLELQTKEDGAADGDIMILLIPGWILFYKKSYQLPTRLESLK